MTKLEWQQHHGLTNEEMDLLTDILAIFKGKVTKIKDIKSS